MKIALVQSPLAWGELQENLQNFDKKMAECEDCDVILLPEMFTSGCMMIKKSAEVAFAAKESVANAYPVVKDAGLGETSACFGNGIDGLPGKWKIL